MNYHLDPNRAYELYQNVGLEFANNIIDPAFSDFIKEVVPQYPFTSLLIKRDEIRNSAKQKLADHLQRYGIIVDDVYISDIAFSSDYQAAIEKKQTAQQAVETERQVLEQRRVQAEQNVAEAEGKARAAVATAKGEADANRAKTESITPQLIDYLRWTRWDGRLPQFQGGATADQRAARRVPRPRRRHRRSRAAARRRRRSRPRSRRSPRRRGRRRPRRSWSGRRRSTAWRSRQKRTSLVSAAFGKARSFADAQMTIEALRKTAG